ncbi:DUF1501 domain-containing protein [Verrucomicrobiales bacterium]|jgi:hypothetical protein|nr:DUF1501 domain-containing protein [Verrucomicrobiales bacterium]
MDIKALAGKTDFSRRSFIEQTARTSLGVSVATTFGSALGGKASAQEAPEGGGKAKSLIYIYCSGGMTHLDTFDPKENKAVMGDTKVISSKVDGMRFGEHLDGLAEHADKLAVINSMSSTNGAHAQARYQMMTGYNQLATIVHPHIGPYAEKYFGKRGDLLPDSVVINRGTSNSGYLDPALSPLPVANPETGIANSTITTSEDRFAKRMEMSLDIGQNFVDKYKHYSSPKGYVEFYDQAARLLQSDELKVFDLSTQDDREAYGMNSLGQGCLLARRLVENGVRVIEVHCGGWDMHNDVTGSLATRLPSFNQAISALLSDLDSSGLLDSTMVVVGSDFGRTSKINDRAGRDHQPAVFSTVFAGGGITGGQVYGSSDKDGRRVGDKKVSVEDFHATIGYGLGIDLSFEVYSPSGRPFVFGNHGTPVSTLFS